MSVRTRRRAGWAMTLFAALSLNWLAACASSDPEEPDTASVLTDDAEAITNDADLEELQSSLDDATREFENGEYERALVMIKSILATDPVEPFGHGFRALQVRVKDRLLRTTFVNAVVRFEGRRFEVGGVVKGEVILENVSRYELKVPSRCMVPSADGGEPEESRAVFRTQVTYREFQPTNTLVTNRDVENFALDDDIVLKPGETHRLPVAIDTMEINPGGTMLRSYTMGCRLHSAEITVGEEVFHGVLEFVPAVMRVYPRNAEHLEARALENVKKAYRAGVPTHMTLAASFVPEGGTDQLIDFLEFELRRDGTPDRMRNAIMTSLLIASGEEKHRGRDEWLTWIERRRL